MLRPVSKMKQFSGSSLRKRIANVAVQLASLGVATFILFGAASKPLQADDAAIPSSRIERLIGAAASYIGTPYRFGGDSASGVDCAALMRRVFRAVGVELPRTAAEQFAHGSSVVIDNLRPGDLVFFKDTYRKGISHVGIYLGGARFLHAATHQGAVAISSLKSAYYASRFAGGRRVIDDEHVVARIADASTVAVVCVPPDSSR
jgi:cell wall-associated NlpC family hydrolase